MLSDSVYYIYPEGEKYVRKFFNAVFVLRKDNIANYLTEFKNQRGIAVNDDLVCYFASELSKEDPEYFGDSGVVIYVNFPIAETDVAVILEYEQFLNLIQEYIDRDSDEFSPKELSIIRNNFGDVKKSLIGF